MTNKELFTDLKQFVEATVSQHVSQLATKSDLGKIEASQQRLEDAQQRLEGAQHRLENAQNRLENAQYHLADNVAVLNQKIDIIQDAIADTVQDHEYRLQRLEKRRP